MIRIDHTETFGFEAAIRGMRNPYESHDKSDSGLCKDVSGACCPMSDCCGDDCDGCRTFGIGKVDMTLAKKLIKAGSEHRKFLRMIHVQADVLAPRYWWAEMDKYKYVEANSSSTMHLITKRELTEDDFSIDNSALKGLLPLDLLNYAIKQYNSEGDAEMKEIHFRSIKQMLPESYNQLRTIDTNYEALLSINHQRKNHRLSEWKEFCEWIRKLPYMDEFLAAGQQIAGK